MAELVDFECSVHGFRVATFESAAVTCGLEGCQRSCSPPQWVRARQDSVRRRASAGTWTGRPGPGGHRTGRATAHQQQEPEAVVETDSGPEPVRPSQVPSNASPMMTRTTDTRKTVHHCQSPCRPLTGGITTGTLAAVGKRRLKAGTLTSHFFLNRSRQIRESLSTSQLVGGSGFRTRKAGTPVRSPLSSGGCHANGRNHPAATGQSMSKKRKA
jgi:hypothetical protein